MKDDRYLVYGDEYKDVREMISEFYLQNGQDKSLFVEVMLTTSLSVILNMLLTVFS